MIATPITREEAERLSCSDDCRFLGNLLRRLVYAGAKPSANATLDDLAEPLEQYMTHEKCVDFGYVYKLGLDWVKTREHYYERYSMPL